MLLTQETILFPILELIMMLRMFKNIFLKQKQNLERKCTLISHKLMLLSIPEDIKFQAMEQTQKLLTLLTLLNHLKRHWANHS